MKTFPFELVIFLFVLAAALVQFLLRSRQARQPPPAAPAPAPDQTRLEVPEPAWRRAQATVVPDVPEIRFGRPAAATVSIPPPRRGRFDRRSLIGNRRDLQRAIVIAAIVGPCRALEPHDIR